LRLNPAVRDALAAIVHTLNGPGSAAAACAVADGLFVPLHELEQRGIQPALAARALAEVRLLVHKDHKRPPTVSREFAGAPTVGLVICPSCVEGFDPAAFTVTEPEEH
jgi:conjugal transfer pilus assembly protein TraI